LFLVGAVLTSLVCGSSSPCASYLIGLPKLLLLLLLLFFTLIAQ
jgi:hypothetical protein